MLLCGNCIIEINNLTMTPEEEKEFWDSYHDNSDIGDLAFTVCVIMFVLIILL